jgi:ribonuclease Z
VSLRTIVVDTSWGPLKVVGGSRAGEGTVVLLPQLKLALDAGRAHRALAPMNTIFISHGHMDHVGAVGYWASQRFLNSMGRATLVVPQAISSPVARILETFAELEGGRPYEIDVVAVDDGGERPLRPDMDLRFFATDHWVPTLGCVVVWKKRALRAELAGLPGEEIARRRRSGQLVSEQRCLEIVSYCADSGPGIFEDHPEVVRSEVVLLECSFFKPEDRERATAYGHMHLDDLLAAIDQIQCRHLILLHASRRHRLREVESILDEQLQPKLSGSLHHLMVDWD